MLVSLLLSRHITFHYVVNISNLIVVSVEKLVNSNFVVIFHLRELILKILKSKKYGDLKTVVKFASSVVWRFWKPYSCRKCTNEALNVCRHGTAVLTDSYNKDTMAKTLLLDIRR